MPDPHLKEFNEMYKSAINSLIDALISGLELQTVQDMCISKLLTIGQEAVPKLQLYLEAQAKLERELINDLENYYKGKGALEIEYEAIAKSPTVPAWAGSNKKADALTNCFDQTMALDLLFVNVWGAKPEEFTGFSNPKAGPNRIGVQGTLGVLESIWDQYTVSLLEKLVEQARTIQDMALPNGYCSVFTLGHRSLKVIAEKIEANKESTRS